ncbi:hypothetical protein [Sulfolobus islandicus rod-shaped virus 11]|uniref:Uncharacterized protein n=1 Tax=Sulfolobus islandicus rod-shaped virus 11 TaxID=1983546 RepID=A0A1X9SKD2_9VIRU|nr:hypothetical protein CCL47_gp13 [Sulfolobus islandicus rod-shaped virus 11]ARQ96692.1 hypothetical protein [Sulfolobus islandicus rod-shaped virus 11]
MNRTCREIIVFLIFLIFILPAIGILSLGILTKNTLEIIISIVFASGVFALMFLEIVNAFADIYDEIDELKQEIERLKKKR